MEEPITEFEPNVEVDEIDSSELAPLVATQSSIMELLLSEESVETTLFAIVTELEQQWENVSGAIIWPLHDHVTRVVANTPLDQAVINLIEEGRNKSTRGVLKIELDEESAFAAAWVTSIVDTAAEAQLVVLVKSLDDLTASDLGVMERYAQLAQLAIRQHSSELRLQRAIAEERQKLAGIVHDDPIQAMTAVGLLLQRLPGHVDEDGIQRLADVQASVRVAVERMRRLLIDLHPPTLDEEGLAASIDVYLSEVLEPLDIECVFVDDLRDEPDLATASLAYRLASEALWNVVKHAAATRVHVEVGGSLGSVEITITDDGVGFDLVLARRRRIGHLGLSASRELARRASGSWEITSQECEGTSVVIRLPGAVPLDHAPGTPPTIA